MLMFPPSLSFPRDRQDWNIALVGRILFFILRVHHSQIVANRIMRQSLNSLRKHLKVALNRQKVSRIVV